VLFKKGKIELNGMRRYVKIPGQMAAMKKWLNPLWPKWKTLD
jgi:hypothetical protein